MTETTTANEQGGYANICLTVIAVCLVILCFRSNKSDSTRVEIIGVAPSVENALPIKIEREVGGVLDRTPSFDRGIPVRIVGIEKPMLLGRWDAIPVRGPEIGELGGMIWPEPVQVRVKR